MSSAQPPVMYAVSLWSMPYEAGAPTRLLQAQERELLKDLRHAIDKRIENKIASARRFAVSEILAQCIYRSRELHTKHIQLLSFHSRIH